MGFARRYTLHIPFGATLTVFAIHCGLDVRGSAEPPLPDGSTSSSSSNREDAASDATVKAVDGSETEGGNPEGGGCSPVGGACTKTADCCYGSCEDENGSLRCQE